MGRRIGWMLIGLVVGWAGSAYGQAFRVVGGGAKAAEFRSAATSGGIFGTGEVLRAEVTHSQSRNSVAVVGISKPQPGWGWGGWFEGGWFGVDARGRLIAVRGLAGGASATLSYGVNAQATVSDESTSTSYGVHGAAFCADGGTTCKSYAVYASGDLVWTGSHYHVSDLRFKESLAPLEAALPKLLALEVVSYEHVQTEEVAHMNLPEGPQVGFVAQQVAEVLPELVAEAVHPPAEDAPEGNLVADPIRYQALKTIDLIPYLVRAVQEQQAEIEALKAQLLPLRNRLAGLEPQARAAEPQMPAAF